MRGAHCKRIKWLRRLFVVTVLAVGGCLSGPAPTDQFYQLELPEPIHKFDTPPLNGTLQVTRPEANAVMGERPLLYRQNSQSTQVHRYTYHRWVDSPTILLQQEMTRYLRASFLADQVITPQFRVKVNYLLSSRILKLERIVDGSHRVVLELELGITSIRDNQALLIKTYREEESANGTNMEDSVVAYNQALAKILNRFLEDVSILGKDGQTIRGR